MIIRSLSSFEREDLRKFYLALSAEDRRKRFCSTLSDAPISKYVDRLNFAHDAGVLGLVHHAGCSDGTPALGAGRVDYRGARFLFFSAALAISVLHKFQSVYS